MNIARKVLVVLAGFACITAISLAVYLLTLQTTIMDRSVVKGWLVNSKVYEGKIIPALVNSTTKPAEVQQAEGQPANAISASPTAITNALSAAFTPEFVQTNAEKTIDNFYDYAEGKTSKFTFSVPIDQKRDTIIQRLSKEIQPQIAALPICTQELAAAQTPCRPPNESVEYLAQKLTTESIDKSKIFDKPLTNETATDEGQQTSSGPLQRIPAIFATIKLLLAIVFPVIIISLIVVAFASTADARMLTLSGLAKRVFFSTIITFVIAVALTFFTKSNDLGLSSSLPGEAGLIIAPFIQQIIGGILGQLALFSGIACIIGLAGWIGFKRLQHQPTTVSVINADLSGAAIPTLDKNQPADVQSRQ